VNEVSIKDSEDPSILFEQVSAMRNCYDTVTPRQMDEGDLIAVVMVAAPKEYVPVITSEQRARGNLFSLLDDIKIVMYQQWCQQAKGSIDKQATEITSAGFKG
jgi:hypothetical protein